MANQPSHKEVYFLRTVRVRRDHIQGDSDDGTNGLMRIVERGESLKIVTGQATFLIVDGTSLDVRLSDNKILIDEDRRALAIEKQATESPAKTRKAA